MSAGKPDPYEAKYMAGAHATARARKRMPPHYHVVFAAPIAGLVVAAIAAGALPLLAAVPLLLIPWLLFMAVRIHVTREHVHIQLGIFGPKIPIARIDAVRVETYDAAKYGEKVIRTAADGSTAYYVAGGSDRGVRIEYRDEEGAPKSVFVSCEQAQEIVSAIERARADTTVRARVDASDAEGDEHEVAAGAPEKRERERARR